MGLIRGAGSVIVGVLLFFSILASGGLLMISSSLEYDNVAPAIQDIVNETMEQEDLESSINNESLEILEDYCEPHENLNMSVLSIKKQVPCPIIISGKNETIAYIRN